MTTLVLTPAYPAGSTVTTGGGAYGAGAYGAGAYGVGSYTLGSGLELDPAPIRHYGGGAAAYPGPTTYPSMLLYPGGVGGEDFLVAAPVGTLTLAVAA